MTVGELIERLRADGWILVERRGGARRWGHLWKPGRATIGGRSRERLGHGTAARLLRHVGLAEAAAAPRRSPAPVAVEARDEVPGGDRAGGAPLVGVRA